MCVASFEISSMAEYDRKRICWSFFSCHSRECHKRVTHWLSSIFSLCCVWSSFSCVGRMACLVSETLFYVLYLKHVQMQRWGNSEKEPFPLICPLHVFGPMSECQKIYSAVLLSVCSPKYILQNRDGRILHIQCSPTMCCTELKTFIFSSPVTVCILPFLLFILKRWNIYVTSSRSILLLI